MKGRRAVKRVEGSVEAKPGYFAVSMENSIRAEMTTTNHTALYRFTFPSNSTMKRQVSALPYSPVILADLTDLSDSRTDGKIKVDQETGRITGNGTFSPSFGIGTYELHFCADFKGAKIRDAGVWINNRAGNSTNYLVVAKDGNNDPPLPAGAYVQFQRPESDQILARVGVSFFSTDQACKNAEMEIEDFDFAGVREAAEEAWKSKLGVISVDNTGIDKSLQRLFWSGLYRSFISPQDYTGESRQARESESNTV
jgi:putative alpha-1,2-mannosidase